PENHPLFLKGNVEQIAWFDMEEIPANLGFDHAQIIHDAHLFLKNNLKDRLIIGELLPKRFTLSELQGLYEDILGIKLDKRNFRKRIFQMEVLKNTGEVKTGIKGGPVLYEYDVSQKG
ncbi:MAG: NUDIX hydrolase, partial [Bacteroidota bacterium]|nr:NUDIX hydrolase [Bacteroidota bacterium]